MGEWANNDDKTATAGTGEGIAGQEQEQDLTRMENGQTQPHRDMLRVFAPRIKSMEHLTWHSYAALSRPVQLSVRPPPRAHRPARVELGIELFLSVSARRAESPASASILTIPSIRDKVSQ